MSIADITRNAVLDAIAECDQKGIESFLEEYGYKEAKRYYLVYNRKRYPSKAILGIAHKYARPEIGPLKASEFSGGRDTVQRKLEQLDFQVFVGDLQEAPELTFERGQVYWRAEIQDILGGQRYGGISTPQASNYILLFTGEQGKEFGYADGWKDDEGVFFYTGEGQVGDMQFTKGNLAIRDHVMNGKELLLFSQTDTPGYVTFVDEMILTGYHFEVRPDLNGVERQAIIFELAPQDHFAQTETEPEVESISNDLSLERLREIALASATAETTPKERKHLVYARSAAIKLYALKRANGICGGCDNPAPFLTAEGRPFLEVHHLRKIADGGPDHPEWVIALCPNCHRKAHFAANKDKFTELLKLKIYKQEIQG